MPWLLHAALLLSPLAAAEPEVPRGATRDTLPLYRPWRDASKVFVEATLPDGRAGLFLVDTGSDTSMITRGTADRLALPVLGDEVTVSGLTGTARVDMSTLPWVRLGGVVVPSVDVAVAVPGQPESWGAMPVDGILGNNVWSRFVLELDYRANVLVLDRPGSTHLPRRATTLHFDGGHPHAPIQFTTRDQPERHHAVVLAIDTGATGIILRGAGPAELDGQYTEGLEPLYGLGAASSLPPAAHLRATRRIPLDGVVIGGRRVSASFEARWLEFDGRTHEALTVRGLAGHELFEGHRLVLDYRGGKFLLARSARVPRFHDGTRRALELDVAAHGVDAPHRLLARARLHLGLGEAERAAALLHEALLRGEPEHADQAVQARVLLARLRRSQGRIPEADALLAPLPAEALVDQGELVAVVNGLLLDAHRERAWRLVSRALGRRPDAPEVHVAHADLLLAEGRAAEAHEALVRASALTGHPDAHLLRKARVALARGDRDGALAILRGGVQSDPLDGRLLWLYAQVAGADDRATLQRDIERAASRVQPRLRPIDYLVGAHAALGQRDEALGLMEAGITRDCGEGASPQDDNCHAWYWTLAGDRLDEALRRIDRALATAGGRSDFLDTKAMVHLARGEVEAARAASLLAARLSPEDPYMLWQAARISALLGAPGRATASAVSGVGR